MHTLPARRIRFARAEKRVQHGTEPAATRLGFAIDPAGKHDSGKTLIGRGVGAFQESSERRVVDEISARYSVEGWEQLGRTSLVFIRLPVRRAP